MFDQKLPRRALLKGALAGLAAIPVVAAVTRAEAAAPVLDANDPQAKALGYIVDTTKVERTVTPSRGRTMATRGWSGTAQLGHNLRRSSSCYLACYPRKPAD